MTTHQQIAERYVREVTRTTPRYLSDTYAFMHVIGNTLYSYGPHFVLAEPHKNKDGSTWFLLNGDRYSVSTSRHQSITRDAVRGHQYMIVPFTALSSAAIDRDTINPVHVTADRDERVTRRGPLPAYMRGNPGYYNAREISDGTWEWEASEHRLGEALFTAAYTQYKRNRDGFVKEVRHTAYFLSAFDTQEGRLYFLAQLPSGAKPATVDEAREALRPGIVRAADVSNIPVLRQGDIFAIKTSETSRDLPGPSDHSGYVLGTSHVATEVRVKDGVTFARGILRHRPPFRDPDHRAVKLGDGKTWWRLAKNTVPEGRSWSNAGKVD